MVSDVWAINEQPPPKAAREKSSEREEKDEREKNPGRNGMWSVGRLIWPMDNTLSARLRDPISFSMNNLCSLWHCLRGHSHILHVSVAILVPDQSID